MGNELPPFEESPLYPYMRRCVENMEARQARDENTRKLLRKLRDTWGYDLDMDEDFVPTTFPLCPVDMSNEDCQYIFNDCVLNSRLFAIHKINEITGENYKFKELINVVISTASICLLTFTAVDADEAGADDDADVVTFQAMVELPLLASFRWHELLHWRIIETA